MIYHFLIDISFILAQLIVFILNYFLFNKLIFQPAVIFSFLWFLILLLHFIFSFTLLNELFLLNASTQSIFLLGTFSFSLGSFLQTVFFKKYLLPLEIISIKGVFSINYKLRLICLLVIIIGLPFFIWQAYKVFIASNIDNFLIGLRTELSYGDENLGSLKYLLLFSIVVFSINLFSYLKHKNNRNRNLYIISLIISIIYIIFSTGRSFFLLLLAIYIGLNFLLSKNFSVKRVLFIFGTFLIIFTSIGLIYGKGGNVEESINENLFSGSQTTASYLVCSLNALDLEVRNPNNTQGSLKNSLRFFIIIGEKLTLITTRTRDVDLIQPFVFVPYPTNVYTVYSPYIKDYGRIYSWGVLFIFGLLHTWLFNKSFYLHQLKFGLYYSLLLFPLLISFFMDFYLTITSMWLQFIFFIELIYFINTKLYTRKKNLHL